MSLFYIVEDLYKRLVDLRQIGMGRRSRPYIPALLYMYYDIGMGVLYMIHMKKIQSGMARFLNVLPTAYGSYTTNKDILKV